MTSVAISGLPVRADDPGCDHMRVERFARDDDHLKTRRAHGVFP
jgi:hypothetical protein